VVAKKPKLSGEELCMYSSTKKSYVWRMAVLIFLIIFTTEIKCNVANSGWMYTAEFFTPVLPEIKFLGVLVKI